MGTETIGITVKRRKQYPGAQQTGADDPSRGKQTVTLVVGDLERWLAGERQLPEVSGFVFVDVSDLTTEFLHEHAPDIILSPLLVRDYDAFDIARCLQSLAYTGRYRVISNGLPDPDLITKEVTAIAPELDFAVLNLPLSALQKSST